MIGQDKSVGPREVQRTLNLSSPALAVFHLEKLERAGLLKKFDDGTYGMDRIYLKHYVRLRRYLIPRYMFYAAVSTFFILGWAYVLFVPASISGSSFWVGLSSQYSFTLLLIYSYGLTMNLILCGFFWYETWKVMRTDKI